MHCIYSLVYSCVEFHLQTSLSFYIHISTSSFCEKRFLLQAGVHGIVWGLERMRFEGLRDSRVRIWPCIWFSVSLWGVWPVTKFVLFFFSFAIIHLVLFGLTRGLFCKLPLICGFSLFVCA